MYRRSNFGLKEFLWRWLAAFLLVTLTYNPTQFCYIRWAMQPEGSLPLKILLGAILIILYAILIRASLNSLGKFGMILTAIFFAIVVWVMYSFGWLSSTSGNAFFWIVDIILSLVFAIGLCWAALWRRLTGQYSVEDMDDA